MALNTEEEQLEYMIRWLECYFGSEDRFHQTLCNVSTAKRYDIIWGKSAHILSRAYTNQWNTLKTMRCAFQGFTSNQKYKLLEADSTLHSAVNLSSLQLIEYILEGLTEGQIVSLLEKKDKYGRSALDKAKQAPFEVLHTLLAFVSRKTKTALITREFSPLHCYNYICRLNGLWRNQADMIGQRISAELSKSDEKIQALEGRCTRQGADMNSLKDELNALRQEETRMTQNLAEANTKVGALDMECQQLAADVNSLEDELENQKAQLQREKTQSALDLVEANAKVGALDLQCQRQAADVSSLKDELENQKRQQQREKARLADELDSSKRKTESLEAICTTHASSIDFLKSHHYELRRKNIQLLEETRRQAVKQERIERMMEEMERLLRQPICIGPEMDQEHEE